MLKIAFASLALLVCVPASAANTLITFEEPGLTGMSNSPGAAVPVGSQLSNQFLSTLGVSFSSGAGYVAVVNHYPDPLATPSPPNVIGGTNAGGTLNYDAAITASFFWPANTAIKATTDFVQVLGDRYPVGSGGATLSAYDISGVLIGSVFAPDTGAYGTGLTLTLNIAGIHSVSFVGNNGTIAFDNFEFGALTPVTQVPEPASWAMMIMGLGIVGLGMRRQRVQVRQVAAL